MQRSSVLYVRVVHIVRQVIRHPVRHVQPEHTQKQLVRHRFPSASLVLTVITVLVARIKNNAGLGMHVMQNEVSVRMIFLIIPPVLLLLMTPTR